MRRNFPPSEEELSPCMVLTIPCRATFPLLGPIHKFNLGGTMSWTVRRHCRGIGDFSLSALFAYMAGIECYSQFGELIGQRWKGWA